MKMKSACIGTHFRGYMETYTITEKQTDIGMIPIVQFPALSAFPELRHGFSTRRGGVSCGIYESMNLSFGRGDSEEAVRENFRRMCLATEIPFDTLSMPKQTHSTTIRIATASDCGNGLDREIPFDSADGQITSEPGVALVVFCSDCTPIYLYDPVRKAIGLSHAGWRGTVAEMAGKTVTAMKDTFGCEPENLIAVIGPSIGPECFEVGDEVAEEFADVFGAETIQRQYGIRPHVDLQKANRLSMIRAGMNPDRIIVSGLCTKCHSDLLFSHRATAGKRGGNAGFLMIRKPDEEEQ